MKADLVEWESRSGESSDPQYSAPPEWKGSSMWLILLEAGVALALLIFIVWWTMPRRKPEQDRAAQPKLEQRSPPRADESRDE